MYDFYMFSKYILVGIINTAITALLILLLMYLGLGVYTSNAFGYIAGIIVSFIFNTLFTFSTKLTWKRFIKFIINCGICYVVNLVVIYLVLSINNEWIYFAQLCGMGAYTVSGFILNKLWVMK